MAAAKKPATDFLHPSLPVPGAAWAKKILDKENYP
jgi:hypothetical protein